MSTSDKQHSFIFKPALADLRSEANTYSEEDQYSFADWLHQKNTVAICERLEAVLIELQRIRKSIEDTKK